MKKIRFIINPNSGVHKKNDLPRLITDNIDKKKFEIDIVHTQYAGHARSITQDAIKLGFDIVCAVGGDGSIHEVGTELIGKKCRLAIMPAGSGNGLARHLNIPLDLNKALKVINKDQSYCMDTILVNDKSFLNVGGFGFDALIAKKFASYKNRGFWGYARLISKEYFSYQPEKMSVEVNNQTIDGEFILCSIANASEFGNGLCISPSSVLNDGKAELCLLRPFPALSTPSVLYKLFKKRNDQNTYSEIIPFEKARITMSNSETHFDGEPYELSTTLNIEVNPQSLNVIV